MTGIEGHCLVVSLDPMTAYLSCPFCFEMTCTSKQPNDNVVMSYLISSEGT